MVLPDALSEPELIALCDMLRQTGLPERSIQDVLLLLSFKPDKVQRAFYHVAMGKTQEWTAKEIGVSQRQVSSYIKGNCGDIRKYFIEVIPSNS